MFSFLNRFPSLSLTLCALLAGFGAAYIIHLLERFGGINSEELMWRAIIYLGWWLWSIPVVASTIGLWYMIQLDRPRTPAGWISRVGSLTGFFLYMFSWGNTALGAIAGIITVVSFVILIRQIAHDCLSKRERPDYSGQPMLVRFLSTLTTELDDKVKG